MTDRASVPSPATTPTEGRPIVKIEPLERSRTRRRLGAAALALATVAGGWALTTESAQAATHTVNAKDFAFTPQEITITVGDTVRWVNGDGESHDLQGTTFGSGELPAGGSYSHTFTAPASDSYFCKLHTYMTGTVNVVARSAPAPAPAPTPTVGAPSPAPTVAPAPTTTTVPPTTTTTRPPSTFQDVPDDPAARKPPGGDGRSQGATVPGSAANPPTTSGPTTTAPPRGSTFQDVPEDTDARRAPGETDVAARSASATRFSPAQEVVDEEHGPSPPGGPGVVHTDGLGDGTQLAPFTVKDGVKEFHLTLDETEIEVSPGVVKPAYAINGTVPGPVLRVNEGDRVRIVVDNQLPFPTSTHWHGMILPNDQDGVGGITQPHIEPGTTYTYEWTAEATGTHWYHAHSSGRHIGRGLYGALEVVPRSGDLEADEDYRLMLGDTDLGFTINGRSFPSTPVLETKVGDRVRLRVINTGDQVHAFHLHGVPFRVMAQDGIPLADPPGMDTLTISPGQTYDLLFTQKYAGDWVIHCHMFIHSHMTGDTHPPGESGMNGMTAIVRATERGPDDPPAAEVADGEHASATHEGDGGDDGSPVLPLVAAVLIVATFGLLYRRTLQRTPTTTSDP